MLWRIIAMTARKLHIPKKVMSTLRVSNPSIIFIDEPTSGLDARFPKIDLLTVRNTVDVVRTVACTIYQPSIDIFKLFDEESHGITVSSMPRVEENSSGALSNVTALENSLSAAEVQIGVDLAEVYTKNLLSSRRIKILWMK